MVKYSDTAKMNAVEQKNWLDEMVAQSHFKLSDVFAHTPTNHHTILDCSIGMRLISADSMRMGSRKSAFFGRRHNFFFFNLDCCYWWWKIQQFNDCCQHVSFLCAMMQSPLLFLVYLSVFIMLKKSLSRARIHLKNIYFTAACTRSAIKWSSICNAPSGGYLEKHREFELVKFECFRLSVYFQLNLQVIGRWHNFPSFTFLCYFLRETNCDENSTH